MAFPTPQDIEDKKVQKLAPEILKLETLCIEKMTEEGIPLKVPVGTFSNISRGQVVRSAIQSGWRAKLEHDLKLGDVIVIEELPPVPVLARKWWQL